MAYLKYTINKIHFKTKDTANRLDEAEQNALKVTIYFSIYKIFRFSGRGCWAFIVFKYLKL